MSSVVCPYGVRRVQRSRQRWWCRCLPDLRCLLLIIIPVPISPVQKLAPVLHGNHLLVSLTALPLSLFDNIPPLPTTTESHKQAQSINLRLLFSSCGVINSGSDLAWSMNLESNSSVVFI